MVIGGDFTGVNGKFNQNLAFLNRDGTLPDHNGGIVEGPVKSIRTLYDGSALVAGNFGYVLGSGCTGLAHITNDGYFDTAFRPVITQANGTVADLHSADMDDNFPGKYTIMGTFANVYDSNRIPQLRSAFARLNSDGTLDPNLTAGITLPNSSNVSVNAGGSFGNGNYGMVGSYVNNQASESGFACILNQNGSQQSYMLFNGAVKCGTGLSDGRIVVGGKFTQVVYPAQANRGHIAALTPNFALDSSFAGVGANGHIFAMSTEGEHDTGNVLIGGDFTAYGGQAINRVARLNRNGSLDPSFNPGGGPNGPVYAIRWTQWGNNGRTIGKATLGGAFTSYNGTPMPGIAQVFASMGASLDPVYYLLLLSN